MIMEKILIVEDNPMVLKSLEFKLKRDGYDIVVAEDGRIAKELLSKQTFDLIITDLMLPFVTGIQLIEHVKSQYPSTPVIVLSTSKQEEIITNAFDLGVEDFITKPFSPNELSVRVKRSIKSS